MIEPSQPSGAPSSNGAVSWIRALESPGYDGLRRPSVEEQELAPNTCSRVCLHLGVKRRPSASLNGGRWTGMYCRQTSFLRV